MAENVSSPQLASRLPLTHKLVLLARAGEWWAYKFAPILATAYATATLVGVSLWPLLPQVVALLLAFTVGASYVSIINDWTDRADDAAAGKPNRLAHTSGPVVALLLGLCLGAGLGFGWYFWQLQPLAGLLYLGAWVVYSLYSLPPFRLKERGLAGVLADAAGAHVFPQLLTAVLLSQWAGRPVPGLWLLAVGGWALGCGVRNILWHQLGDAAHDVRAGVVTFVTRQGRGAARWLAKWLAFPLEIAGFSLLLVMSSLVLPLGLLLLYMGLEWFRYRVWHTRLVIAEPQSNHRILLNEYYEVFYPLAFLLIQVSRYPADGAVLALHLLLFGRHSWRSAQALGRAGLIIGRKIWPHRLP
jgi:4-hydroxybenzoate polyprenyltransferase